MQANHQECNRKREQLIRKFHDTEPATSSNIDVLNDMNQATSDVHNAT
jgi:hypothetical protein